MKVLIDCSLTGGRGPAKKAMELTKEFDLKGIDYVVMTDAAFKSKLDDLGVKVSYVVQTSFAETPAVIIEKFREVAETIDFDLMIKLGARMAGPLAAMKLGKQYIIADGGLPDYTTEEEGLYQQAIFDNAKAIYLTTQFDWVYPNKLTHPNIQTCLYPIATETLQVIEQIQSADRSELVADIAPKITNAEKLRQCDLAIDLVMTGDYLDENNLDTFGGWLKTAYYDQCVVFVRRLVLSLGVAGVECCLFLDTPIQQAVQDLLARYPNVTPVTYAKQWDFQVELYMKALCDVTISRATNYQPYIAALGKGANITTPVPAAGYMDEDTAGYQYQNTRMTHLIEFDDKDYVKKMLAFVADQPAQDLISKARAQNDFVAERNLCKLLLEMIEG